MIQLKNNFYLLLFSFVIFCLVASTAGWAGHTIVFVTAAITYCILTFSVLSNRTSKLQRAISLLLILFPILIFITPAHVFQYNATITSFPSFLAYFIGVTYGLVIFLANKFWRIVFSVTLLLLTSFMYFKGYSMWLNKINYGSYSQEIVAKSAPIFEFFDETKNVISNNSVKNKMLVLDFWTTSCGLCFEKFPTFQRKKIQYKDNPNILFYTVNIPFKRDSIGQANKLFRSFNLDIVNLNASSYNVASKFGIVSYPTVIIIYKGRVLYRGDIENIDPIIRSNYN